MIDFLVETIFPVGFGLLFLGLICLGLIGACDGIQSIRARTAIYECERQNMQAVRKSFSTDVACRARNMGSDTLNLKQVAP